MKVYQYSDVTAKKNKTLTSSGIRVLEETTNCLESVVTNQTGLWPVITVAESCVIGKCIHLDSKDDFGGQGSKCDLLNKFLIITEEFIR